ncbi:Protein of unknown function D [Prunus dulcis]|uniref:Ternary complex factor MIP1 leucine-zipper domain-containing protein n=1 Tax=Prunus dulcis TaxID=3755 RepID=A0A4Y1RYM2_PRUDU|nr:Protein of unknown function D [Prunus dulcis]
MVNEFWKWTKPSFDLIMHEIKWQGNSLMPFKFMEGISKHKRSNSEPVNRKFEKDKLNSILEAPYSLKMKEMGRLNCYVEAMMKRQSTDSDVQSSLNQEILQLQKQLEDQFLVRHALQKALSYRPLSPDSTIETSLPKSTKEVIKEIAVLELEVVYLERYLLSLYRKTFDQQISSELSVAPGQDVTPENSNTVTYSDDLMSPRNSIVKPLKECNDIVEQQKLLDSSIHRTYSSLSQRSTCSTRTSPRTKSRAKAVDSYHSLPFSMLEQAQSATTNVYPTEQLETYFSDQVPDTPNCISEEMIKCIATIFCELADPPVISHDYSSSPITSSSTMLKVHSIRRDAEKLGDIEHALKKFRSLIYRLEEAFLVYGIPQNNLKRVSLLLKAAYNVGGHAISVDMIQRSILGCRLPRPGQWLRLLFSMKTKFKVGDARKAYSIEHPEPLLHFALCSGSHSDPAVRVYTSKRVFEELETAKHEYIQSTFLVHKEQKSFFQRLWSHLRRIQDCAQLI